MNAPFVSPYLKLPVRSETEARLSMVDVIRAGAKSPKLRCYLQTKDGAPFTATLWNPDGQSVADFFECDPSEVDIRDEVVTVRGTVVGTVEHM